MFSTMGQRQVAASGRGTSSMARTVNWRPGTNGARGHTSSSLQKVLPAYRGGRPETREWVKDDCRHRHLLPRRVFKKWLRHPAEYRGGGGGRGVTGFQHPAWDDLPKTRHPQGDPCGHGGGLQDVCIPGSGLVNAGNDPNGGDTARF